jgi:hypothetical protein
MLEGIKTEIKGEISAVKTKINNKSERQKSYKI